LLEELLNESVPGLSAALEASRSSGAFVVLDATVNPSLPDADTSRAALYLKNMEPNIVSRAAVNMRFMIGPMSVARTNGIYVLPQWTMEMDVGRKGWFEKVMETARESDLPISRLYYWCPKTSVSGNGERAMLCAVPLIARDGTVFGVCGFEVSEMLFKLSHTPEKEPYDYIFCMLAPSEEGWLRTEGALFAGSYASGPMGMTEEPMAVYRAGAFESYHQRGGDIYAGLSRGISLYPQDSAYAAEKWSLALMLPERSLRENIFSHTRWLLLSLGLLMAASILLACLLSRRYIRPVVDALGQIKNPSAEAEGKTKILEIDDLIEFLAAQDEERLRAQASADQTSSEKAGESHLFLEFVQNIEKLSGAERAVFNLYMKGHTAKEIADILCLSINTIKTHNRRIYMKLNVTSRKELMVYIQMMEEAKRNGAGVSPSAGAR
jgi:DNA-binding CsgD family transcriptional regulator